jgi:hypothetical protein
MKPLIPLVITLAVVTYGTHSSPAEEAATKRSVLTATASGVDVQPRHATIPVPSSPVGAIGPVVSIRRAPEILPPVSTSPTGGFSFEDHPGSGYSLQEEEGFSFYDTSVPEPPGARGKLRLEEVDGEPYSGFATTRR